LLKDSRRFIFEERLESSFTELFVVDVVSNGNSGSPVQYSKLELKGGALYGEDYKEPALRQYVAAVVQGAAKAYDAAVSSGMRISEFWPVAKALSIHQEHTIATQLLRRGYDGLIFTGPKGAVAGHVFCKRSPPMGLSR
jgi:hypothetical protein